MIPESDAISLLPLFGDSGGDLHKRTLNHFQIKTMLDYFKMIPI